MRRGTHTLHLKESWAGCETLITCIKITKLKYELPPGIIICHREKYICTIYFVSGVVSNSCAEKPFTIFMSLCTKASHCVYRVFRTNWVSTRFDISPPFVRPTGSVNACAAGCSCIMSYHIFTLIWDWQYPELLDQYQRGPRSSASTFPLPCRKRINTTVLIVLWWTFGA